MDDDEDEVDDVDVILGLTEAPPVFVASYEETLPAVLAYAIIVLIFAFIGIPSNILAASVWLQRHFRNHNSYPVYLAALCIGCAGRLLAVTTYSVEILLEKRLHTLFAYPILCEISTIIRFMTVFFVPVLVLALTVDHFIAVRHPQNKSVYCTPRRALYVTLASLLFIFLVSCATGGFFEHTEYAPDVKICTMTWDLHMHMQYWMRLEEVVFKLGVPVCAIVFNILIVKRLRKNPLAPLRVRRTPGVAETDPVATMTIEPQASSQDNRVEPSTRSEDNQVEPPSNSPDNQIEPAATSKLLLIISLFFSIWMLMSGIKYFILYRLHLQRNHEYFLFLRSFTYVYAMLYESMHVWNLFIFLIVDQRFRETFLSLFRCKRPNDGGENLTTAGYAETDMCSLITD